MSDKRAFIEYKEDGQLLNPYSVSLESEDGTYGIKTTGGSVVVTAGTVPDNSSTGVYEYIFDAQDGIIYFVAWKVYPTAGSQPIYVNQTLGPFNSQCSTGVKAVADQRGSFIQDTTASVFLIITDMNGNPIQPESCVVTIQKDGTDVVTEASADFIKDGAYAYDWKIEADQETGAYEVIWKYVVNGSTKYEYQEIVVSEQVEDQSVAFYGNIIAEYRNMFNLLVGCAQAIPVYHEEAIAHSDLKTYYCTFKRWNQSANIRVYRNGKLIPNNEISEINYFKGEVTFCEPQHRADTINCDYNFRWFSDEQIDQFLFNAVSMINLYPPASPYTLSNVPGRFIALMLYGAAKDAIRELMMCLMFQQPQEVFGGSEAAKSALSNLETLKKNYEEEFMKGLEQKKLGPYPKTRVIVTPEYTLPGGRSRWFRYMFGSGTG